MRDLLPLQDAVFEKVDAAESGGEIWIVCDKDEAFAFADCVL